MSNGGSNKVLIGQNQLSNLRGWHAGVDLETKGQTPFNVLDALPSTVHRSWEYNHCRAASYNVHRRT